MSNDAAFGPDPTRPHGRRWQHMTKLLGGKNRGPFENYTKEQELHVLAQGGVGWEMVGITTLQNGWLMLAFRRERLDEMGELAHVGTYI